MRGGNFPHCLSVIPEENGGNKTSAGEERDPKQPEHTGPHAVASGQLAAEGLERGQGCDGRLIHGWLNFSGMSPTSSFDVGLLNYH